MKLVSVNIQYDKHYDKVLELIGKEETDVVCMQEILEEAVPMFEKKLRMKAVFASWGNVKSKHHPELTGKSEGEAIFMKESSLLNSGHYFYENKEDTRVLVWAEIQDEKGKKYKFTNTHLPRTDNGEITIHQLEMINKMLEKLKGLGEVILCGDMNAPRGKESFTRIAKKYKDNIPEKYQTSIDQNLHRVKGIQFMVDGLFTSPSYKALNVKLVDGVSDHMAIVAEIEKI